MPPHAQLRPLPRLAPRLGRRAGRRCGFTLVEILLVIVILAITARLALTAIADTEAWFRADRAARETVAALRYARGLAMSTGNVSGVEFDTTQKKIKVYTMVGATQTWVTSPLASVANGGLYQLDLVKTPELQNVAMTVNIPSDATNPYDCAFSPLGATKNTGTVRFTYAGKPRTVTISAVGDPVIN